MEKIETIFETNEGYKIERAITQYELVEKINEIIDWINDHKDQLLN